MQNRNKQLVEFSERLVPFGAAINTFAAQHQFEFRSDLSRLPNCDLVRIAAPTEDSQDENSQEPWQQYIGIDFSESWYQFHHDPNCEMLYSVWIALFHRSPDGDLLHQHARIIEKQPVLTMESTLQASFHQGLELLETWKPPLAPTPGANKTEFKS